MIAAKSNNRNDGKQKVNGQQQNDNSPINYTSSLPFYSHYNVHKGLWERRTVAFSNPFPQDWARSRDLQCPPQTERCFPVRHAPIVVPRTSVDKWCCRSESMSPRWGTLHPSASVYFLCHSCSDTLTAKGYSAIKSKPSHLHAVTSTETLVETTLYEEQMAHGPFWYFRLAGRSGRSHLQYIQKHSGQLVTQYCSLDEARNTGYWTIIYIEGWYCFVVISSRTERIEVSGIINGIELVITLAIDVFQLGINIRSHKLQGFLQCCFLVNLILLFMDTHNFHFNRLQSFGLHLHRHLMYIIV